MLCYAVYIFIYTYYTYTYVYKYYIYSYIYIVIYMYYSYKGRYACGSLHECCFIASLSPTCGTFLRLCLIFLGLVYLSDWPRQLPGHHCLQTWIALTSHLWPPLATFGYPILGRSIFFSTWDVEEFWDVPWKQDDVVGIWMDMVPSAVHFGARLLLALLAATFGKGQGGAAINERYERSPSPTVPLMPG